MLFRKSALSLSAALLTSLALTACSSNLSGQSGLSSISQDTNVIPHAKPISQTLGSQFIPSMDGSKPPTGTPAIINAWVSLSFAINGVPCGNCVGSPPIGGALGIAFPSPYLPLGSAWEITYTLYNVAEGSSACSLTFAFKQGTTVLFNHTYPINLGGAGQYVYFTSGVLSSKATAGSATVSGHLKCGTYSSMKATQTVYLH
jgi:hypothetical protein